MRPNKMEIASTLHTKGPREGTRVQDFMHVFVTCKFKEDQINSNRENVETPIFLDAHGQLTP